MFEGGLYLPLYSLGGHDYMKILARYEFRSLPEYYSGSFLLFRLVLLCTSSYNWWSMGHILSLIL
jgi:hypothetical protein